MKILHVVSSYLPESTGGTQMQLRDLCHAQKQQGHEPSIFTRIGGDEAGELELSESSWEGIPVVRITNNFLDCDRFERLYTHPIIDQRFRETLERSRPDLVHIHHLTCLSTSMIEVAKEFGAPVVMWLSDFWMACMRGQRIHPEDMTICEPIERGRCVPCLQKLWPHLLLPPQDSEEDGETFGRAKLEAWEQHIARMLSLCDTLMMPSQFHRQRFLDGGLPPEKTRVVTYGIPREELLAEPRGRQPIRRIGYIGTVIPSKGVHTLVEAFQRLDRPELVLDIFGEIVPFHEKTSYLEELESLVQPGREVQFHGRYENRDLPKIFESIDLLVVPSLWWESFCLTAREGALAGLPVVACDLAGLGEAVEQGLALGFEPGNAEELAEVMERLLDDPDLRDRMSRQAHKVRDVIDCANEITEVYRALLPESAEPALPTSPAEPAASSSTSISGVRSAPLVSLVIPTWNAGPAFPEILQSMLSQDLDGELEVIAIDSGSRDGTAEYLATQPVRLLRIPNSEFDHGLTRNLGIQEARGEIVALATQDARPKDQSWLRHLVACFEDPRVAGAYSGQIPRPDANPFIKDRLRHWVATQTEPRVQQIESPEEWEALAPLEKLGRVAFDNVSSSVRRSVALEIPFRRRQFGEDLDWGHRAILAGHRIVFEPRSRVIHSHNNSIWYEFKRVYLDHQNLHRLFGVHTIPRWEDVWSCSKHATRHLREVVENEPDLGSWERWSWKARALPFGFSQNLAQYLGARSVRQLEKRKLFDRAIDRLLRRGV